MYDDYEFDGKESGASTIVGVLILCAVIVGGAFGLIYYLQGPFVGRKFAAALLAPAGFFWLLFFVGAMVATFTKQRFLAALLWLSMIGMSLAGNKTIANNLMTGLESSYQPVVVEQLEDMQYGFVLGGAARVAKNRQIDLNDASERVMEAIRLHKRGKIKHLVFTGSPFLHQEDEAKAKNEAAPAAPPAGDQPPSDPSTDPNKEISPVEPGPEVGTLAAPKGTPVHFKAGQPAALRAQDAAPPAANDVAPERRMISPYEDAMRKLLADYGVAEANYTFLGGRYTQEEMQRIDEFLAGKPAAKHGLITSASHMPRAASLANKQGLSLVSIPVDFRSGNVDEDPIFFIPREGELLTTAAAIREYVAGWLQ
jgi:uncharacterized SAM-binding protein YcdF (DUF218 family)